MELHRRTHLFSSSSGPTSVIFFLGTVAFTNIVLLPFPITTSTVIALILCASSGCWFAVLLVLLGVFLFVEPVID